MKVLIDGQLYGPVYSVGYSEEYVEGLKLEISKLKTANLQVTELGNENRVLKDTVNALQKQIVNARIDLHNLIENRLL